MEQQQDCSAGNNNPVFNLAKAVHAVQNGIKVSEAAAKYGIPASILFNRISAIKHSQKRTVQMSDLSPVKKDPVKPEEPDEYGLIINEVKFKNKVKPPKLGVYVNERLAEALKLVLDGKANLNAAAELYDVKKSTLSCKLRVLKQIKEGKNNHSRLVAKNPRVRRYPGLKGSRQKRFNKRPPYPLLDKHRSIIPTVNKMTWNLGVPFPPVFSQCIIKLESGTAGFKEGVEYFGFDVTIAANIIKLIKRAPKSTRMEYDASVSRIKELLPNLTATQEPSPTSSPTKNAFEKYNFAKAFELISRGTSVTRAADLVKIPYTTLYDYAKQHGYINKYRNTKGTPTNSPEKNDKNFPSPSSTSPSSSSAALVGEEFVEGLALGGRIFQGMKRSASTKSSSKGNVEKALLCLFCHGRAGNEVELGKLHILNKVVVHYYCLLFSSALEQNGDDDEGILGFLAKDILKELNRGKKLKCVHCNQKGATIGCYSKYCKMKYHFPCGLKHHAQFVFTDNFRSFCSKHRKFQTGSNKGEKVECPICLQTMIADPKYAVWSPCCKKSSWFHKLCLQKVALSAGYFFKCPLCNDKNTFIPEMLQQGIYVPEQDASWELEPNAYQELLERPIRCDATKCRCPGGRKNDEEGTSWEVVLCNLCGSTGVHVSCGRLRRGQTKWNCPTCLTMLQESSQRARAEAKESRRTKRSRIKYDEDDSEADDDDMATPAKKLRYAESDTIRMRYSSEEEDVDILNTGSDNERGGNAKVPPPSGLPSDSSSRDTISSHPDEEVFVPRGIRGDVVIADLMEKKDAAPLSDALGELRTYAQGLPRKLVRYNFDEDSFLKTLNELSSGGEVEKESRTYQVTKEHFKRFVRCTFTYDQMRLLRKVFELCFIIYAFKTKISRHQKNVRNDPFKVRRRNGNRNPSLMKKMKALQVNLTNLLTQAKTVNLLEGNRTWTGRTRGLCRLDSSTLPEEAASTSGATSSNVKSEPSTSSSVRYAFLNAVVAPGNETAAAPSPDDVTGRKREKIMTRRQMERELRRQEVYGETKKALSDVPSSSSTPTRKGLRLKGPPPPSLLPSECELDTILKDIEVAEKNFLKELRSQSLESDRDRPEKENRADHQTNTSTSFNDPCHSQQYPPSSATSSPFSSSLFPSPKSTPASTVHSSSSKDSSVVVLSGGGENTPRKVSPLGTSPLQNASSFDSPSSPYRLRNVGSSVLNQSSKVDELNSLSPPPLPSSRFARNLFGSIHPPHSPSPDRSSKPVSHSSSHPSSSAASPSSKLCLAKSETEAQSKSAHKGSQKRRYHRKKDANKYIQPTISSYFQIRPKSK